MIAGSTICASFKAELLQGLHNLASDEFRMALYDKDATLNADTTAYVTEHEVTGTNYVRGGVILTGGQVALGGRIGYASFNDAVWKNVTMTARAALIYNQTRNQKAVAVVDFVRDVTATNGDFRVRIPATPTAALIRIL